MRDLAKYLFLAGALVYVVERYQPVAPATPVVEEQKESPPQAPEQSPSAEPAPSGPDTPQEAEVGVFLTEPEAAPELFTEPEPVVVEQPKAAPPVAKSQPVYYYQPTVQYRAQTCSGPNCSQPRRILRWRR